MVRKILPLFRVFRAQILTKRHVFLILLFAFTYIALAVFLINYKLFFATILGNSSLNYKISVLFLLLAGAPAAFSNLDFAFLIITSFLSGLNVMLAIIMVEHMKRHGFLRLALGGGSILALASTGCASCGFSLMSVFGVGSAFSLFPFSNHILYIVSLSLLLLTTFHMLKKLHQNASCKTSHL